MRHIRKAILLSTAFIFATSLSAIADNYTKLWKQVDDARQKDLPRTQIDLLQTIANKAIEENNYGQLMKAEFSSIGVWKSVSADSILPKLQKLEIKAKQLYDKDKALAATYYSVLGMAYRDITTGDTKDLAKSRSCFDKSLENIEITASKKALDYEPFIVKGIDSRIFNNDLLSVLGYNAERFKLLHDYYSLSGNRPAALITAIELLAQERECDAKRENRQTDEHYINSLDSLISEYHDISECGEAAIMRFNIMRNKQGITDRELIEYIDRSVSRWKSWPRIEILTNAKKEITNPMFSVEIKKNVILPGQSEAIKLRVRNINKISVSITGLDINGDTKLSPETDNDYKTLLKHKIPATATTTTLRYTGIPNYIVTTDSVMTGKLPTGVYLLEIAADNKNIEHARSLLYVSDVTIVHHGLPEKRHRIAVLNATTGQPIPGANISIRSDEQQEKTFVCDEDGEATVDWDNNFSIDIRAYTSSDKALPFTGTWGNYRWYSSERPQQDIKLFTDRSVYRPGQTIHVAGIMMMTTNHSDVKAVKDEPVTLTLKDSNNKTISETTLKSDNFGSFSTDFQLPLKGMTGIYSLRASVSSTKRSLGYASVRVEEYKRPTYTVDFEEVKEKYGNGDTITVTGYAKTYTGIPVCGAKVTYTVNRTCPLWWRGYASNNTTTLNKGEIVTDGNGTFKIDMPMILPAENKEEGLTPYANWFFYEIKAHATVTDMAGETRTGEIALPLSNKATAFSINMPKTIETENIKDITFALKNNAGNDIAGEVKYSFDNETYNHKAETNKPTDIGTVCKSELKSGKHTLNAVCGTDTIRHEFILFSINDTIPCVQTHDWFYADAGQFPENGEPVCVQVGSSDKDVHVLYSIATGNTIIESGSTSISNSIYSRKIAYEDRYGDGIRLIFAWVKDGIAYTHQHVIKKALPDKRLIMEWTTFRDRLTPGQKEEWVLNVKRPDGSPVNAQIMATLYDASLEQIVPFKWSLNLNLYRQIPNMAWKALSRSGFNNNYEARLETNDIKPLTFNSIDAGSLFTSQTSEKGIRTLHIGGYRLSAANNLESAGAMLQKTDAKVYSNVYDTLDNETHETQLAEEETDITNANIPIRDNFNETAFFYPSLITDGNGNINIKFTLPESITSWRFMGMAHDTDMNNGIITADAIAKKTVIIQPNMPRFLRIGDDATISANIFNTSEGTIKGNAIMQLIDPETMKVIYTQKKSFIVDAENNGNVTFNYKPNIDTSLLICRIMAEGKDFSDGEQHYLPVLSDEELVTNTLPFSQHGQGTFTADLKELFSQNGRNEKLTIEYTNNPAWLVLQALPYIAEQKNNDAISIATTFYANTIGKHIIADIPNAKAIFESWKNENPQNSLTSNLERNQELKNIVLDETPWVVYAANENEQRLRLANFFDSANLDNNLGLTLVKLKKLQNNDGGWCWWESMRTSSTYVTASVMEMLVRLNCLTGIIPETKGMIANGLKFIGNDMIKRVANMKKQEAAGNKNISPDHTLLTYLYIYALNNSKLDNNERAAAEYLLAKFKQQNTKQDLKSKALMAVILAQKGETILAEEYLKSLEEYTVITREMGRYYDSPRAGYSWFDYRIPTQVSAIEAMSIIDPEKYSTTIEEMKLWLLQQKRTEGWNTPITSANAVYSFFNNNTSLLENKESTSITLNDKPIALQKATAGIGYVKGCIDNIKKGVIKATKVSDGTSWGAIYAQQLQKVKDVTDKSAGLKITREIILANGNRQSSLHKGDKVVTIITVNADRDYDFVQINDKRAACMEPATQLSGYNKGYIVNTRDNATNYYFLKLNKGKHVIKTEYYIDRAGQYETGLCTIQCAYAPEYSSTTGSITVVVE
ncbi:MAG: MG2 domain-containing protein [Prevotella sp.]